MQCNANLSAFASHVIVHSMCVWGSQSQQNWRRIDLWEAFSNFADKFCISDTEQHKLWTFSNLWIELGRSSLFRPMEETRFAKSVDLPLFTKIPNKCGNCNWGPFWVLELLPSNPAALSSVYTADQSNNSKQASKTQSIIATTAQIIKIEQTGRILLFFSFNSKSPSALSCTGSYFHPNGFLLACWTCILLCCS